MDTDINYYLKNIFIASAISELNTENGCKYQEKKLIFKNKYYINYKNKMVVYNCMKGCCDLDIESFPCVDDCWYNTKKRRQRKAGVFIYDPQKKKVLLVQSMGNFWGPPKGTLNHRESYLDCALREVTEETGLFLNQNLFSRAIKIQHHSVYYYAEIPECNITVQKTLYNDANGVGWISPDCIKDCIENGNMLLSQHCRIVFKHFLNITFPHSNFIVIKKKNNNREFAKQDTTTPISSTTAIHDSSVVDATTFPLHLSYDSKNRKNQWHRPRLLLQSRI